jgi:SH3-like domain-containing protein
MKRLLRILTAAAIVSVSVLAQASEKMVSVARPEINMRAGPGTHHESLWKISRGFPLQVVSRKGDWLQVRDFESDVGWVYRPLVKNDRHFIVKATVVNIRSSPGTGTRIVGKAKYGDVMKTLEHRPNWIKVQHESGRKGWVARRLLWGW